MYAAGTIVGLFIYEVLDESGIVGSGLSAVRNLLPR